MAQDSMGELMVAIVPMAPLEVKRTRSSLTISAKQVGVGAASQPWILAGYVFGAKNQATVAILDTS
jgi:hypothetical protein